LTSAGSEWTVVDRVVESVVRSTTCSNADVRFHLSVLLKRDLVDLNVG